MSDRKEILAIKIARLYYKENQTQENIAKALKISRSTVSRLLSWARKNGLVKITVAPLINEELANLLHEKYGKQFVIVDAEQEDPGHVTSAIGSAAASFFADHIGNEKIIGITWGRTIAQMVEHVQSMPKEGLTIVQMVGCLGNPQRDVHAPGLVLQLARRTNAKAVLLPAPGIVADVNTKNAFMREQAIQSVFRMFSCIDVAFVGIGVLTKDSLIIQDALLTEQDIKMLSNKKAVGDIALRFFDEEGRALRTEIDKRVIGIDLDQLRDIPMVIGVAGGISKLRAIHAALQGDIIDVLITDTFTAQHLLETGGESNE